MVAVKNPNELACCKCKFQETSLGDNGWTCSLTHERGYPHYADALDRLDNCPFNSPITEHKYTYGTQYPFNNIDVVINCKKISFTTGGITIKLDTESIDKINTIEVNGKKFYKSN